MAIEIMNLKDLLDMGEQVSISLDNEIEKLPMHYSQFKAVAVLGPSNFKAFRYWNEQTYGYRSNYVSPVMTGQTIYNSCYGPIEVLMAPGDNDRIEVYLKLY